MDENGKEVNYAWASGILKRIEEKKAEIGLYTFNCAGNWSVDRAYNEAEYNIFRLPDLKQFDGIILDLQHVSIPEVYDELLERVHASGVPVFSLGMPAKGCYYAGINNHEAMSRVIAELYRTCECRNYWCFMGPNGDYESDKRTQAITEFAERMEIDEDYLRIVHGGNDFDYGYDAFLRLLITVDTLPDAVIAVNDDVALGVCEAAKSRGLKVPDDFMLTGFGDSDRAAVFKPRISTVRVIAEDIGYLCVKCFERIWDGEEVQMFNYVPTEFYLSESCGAAGEQFHYRDMLKDRALYGIYQERFEARRRVFASKLSGCKRMADAVPIIDEFFKYMNCSEFYIVVDGRLKIFTKSAGRDVLDLVSLTDFYEIGYPADMMISYAYGFYRNGRALTSLFPAFESPESGNHYLFMPFHFGPSTIGYFVIGNPEYLMENQYINGVIEAIREAAEILYKETVLEYMNLRLLKTAETDTLTGIYNRTGYENNCEKLFRELTEAGEQMLILFVDMDRLKYINNTFGQGMGDMAIKGIAEVLARHRAPGGLVARIGGDEFILIQQYTGEDELQHLIAGVSLDISSYGQRHELPFPISAAIGTVITEPESGMGFEQYVKLADRKMYEDKVKKEPQKV